MASTDYLKLRGRTWFVRVQIPPHLMELLREGKREYVKTLKTGDLNEANRLKHAIRRRVQTADWRAGAAQAQ